jgi:hypothetical protein
MKETISGAASRSPIDGEGIARNVDPGTEVQGPYSGAGVPRELFGLARSTASVSIGVDGEKEIAVPRSAVVGSGRPERGFLGVGRTASGFERSESRPVRTDEERSGTDARAPGVFPSERTVSGGTLRLAGKI